LESSDKMKKKDIKFTSNLELAQTPIYI